MFVKVLNTLLMTCYEHIYFHRKKTFQYKKIFIEKLEKSKIATVIATVADEFRWMVCHP